MWSCTIQKVCIEAESLVQSVALKQANFSSAQTHTRTPQWFYLHFDQCRWEVAVFTKSLITSQRQWLSQETDCQRIFSKYLVRKFNKIPAGLPGRKKKKKKTLSKPFCSCVSVTSNVTYSPKNLVRPKGRPASRGTPSIPSSMKRWRWWFMSTASRSAQQLTASYSWLNDTPWSVTLLCGHCK